MHRPIAIHSLSILSYLFPIIPKATDEAPADAVSALRKVSIRAHGSVFCFWQKAPCLVAKAALLLYQNGDKSCSHYHLFAQYNSEKRLHPAKEQYQEAMKYLLLMKTSML